LRSYTPGRKNRGSVLSGISRDRFATCPDAISPEKLRYYLGIKELRKVNPEGLHRQAPLAMAESAVP
jgi:hypothetical protein